MGLVSCGTAGGPGKRYRALVFEMLQNSPMALQLPERRLRRPGWSAESWRATPPCCSIDGRAGKGRNAFISGNVSRTSINLTESIMSQVYPLADP